MAKGSGFDITCINIKSGHRIKHYLEREFRHSANDLWRDNFRCYQSGFDQSWHQQSMKKSLLKETEITV